MAREFASINLGIWNDDDFRDLTPAAQHLYFVLLTEPTLSYCGVADWRPRKVAQKAAAWALGDLLDAMIELAHARLVLICEDTEEYLVRSFVRHDGVMSHPKLCVSAARATAAIGSNSLRQVVIGELRRLKVDRPELSAWERPEVAEVVKRKHLDGKKVDPFSETFSPGLREAVREAFSQNAPSAFERPYERPYNSNGNPTTSQQQPRGEQLRTEVQRDDAEHAPQFCGESHDPKRDCRACGTARAKAAEDEKAEAKRAKADERAAKLAAAKAAIEACDFCDDRGYTPAAKPCATDDAGRHVWASHYEEATR